MKRTKKGQKTWAAREERISFRHLPPVVIGVGQGGAVCGVLDLGKNHFHVSSHHEEISVRIQPLSNSI